jgi:hypothetical protein
MVHTYTTNDDTTHDAKRFWRRLICVCVTTLFVVGALGLCVARHRAMELRAQNNRSVRGALKTVGLWLCEMYVRNGEFPPRTISGRNGAHLHSWRVECATYFGFPEAAYDRDRPYFSSPNNRTVRYEVTMEHEKVADSAPYAAGMFAVSGNNYAFLGSKWTGAYDELFPAVIYYPASGVPWSAPIDADGLRLSDDEQVFALFLQVRSPTDGSHEKKCEYTVKRVRWGDIK